MVLLNITIDYTIASGVTNSGSVTDTITFVPTVAGVYQYVCVTHPEARGTITVYPAPSAAGPLINVDAVGFGTDRTDLNVTNTFAASVGDLVTVGSEIVKITAVDTVNKNISVDRAKREPLKLIILMKKKYSRTYQIIDLHLEQELALVLIHQSWFLMIHQPKN